MTSAERALSALDGLAAELAAEYTHPALQGRLDQISSHITGLRSLISQLPDEHARETDLDQRLLAAYDGGQWKSGHPDHAVTHTSDAQQRLQAALDARKAVTA